MPASYQVKIVSYHPDMAQELVDLWNRATDACHPITPDLWHASTSADPYFRPRDALVAVDGGRTVGFIVAKRYRGNAHRCVPQLGVGWIALMAVEKDVQRRGIGTRLLQEAEANFARPSVARIQVGGSFFHFTPGIPESLAPAAAFFSRFGYNGDGSCWDVHRDLLDFRIPAVCDLIMEGSGLGFCPFRQGQEAMLLALMGEDAFPARWVHDATGFIEGSGDIGRFMGLWRDNRPIGFTWIHPPGTLETLRWRGFDQGIAALGPVGVAADERGKRLGLTLVAGSVERLRSIGARHTVIDWTDRLSFYGRLDFQPWLRYEMLSKELGASH